MRKFVGILATGAVMLALLLPGTQAVAQTGPGPNGVASEDVEHVAFVPFEAGTATGANFFSQGKDDYMIITSWRSFSIYNINDPLAPALVGNPVPFGFEFENEDVSTNGNIMLFSESLPRNILHIWNIEDLTNPVEVAQVPGAGDHTTSCILNCRWAYGSEGSITDLRDPAKPKLMEEKWGDGADPPNNNGHDVTEVAPGLVLTSTSPVLMLLDARQDPVNPKHLASSTPSPSPGNFVHSNQWPRNAQDRWMISTGETCCGAEQCDETTSAGLTTWDSTDVDRTRTFKEVDTWTADIGTVTDGGLPASAPFGCSSHWFTTHPTWNNGGLIAAGWYHNGTKFLAVDAKGKITEAGWFLPNAGATSGAYWINDKIVYAVDYERGLDILRWTGKTYVPSTSATGGGDGSGAKLPGPLVRLRVSDTTPARNSSITFSTRLARCEGHARTNIQLRRRPNKNERWTTVDTTKLDGSCRAAFKQRANFNRAEFRTWWPKQHDDHRRGKSDGIVIQTN